MTWTLDAITPTLDAGSATVTLDGGPLPSFIFSWSPSYGNVRKTKLEWNKAAYGDGYTQRTGKGINNITRTWDLRFNAVSETTANAIKDFLEARQGGDSFQWIPHSINASHSIIRVTCDSFDIVDNTYGKFDVTATFTQVYGE